MSLQFLSEVGVSLPRRDAIKFTALTPSSHIACYTTRSALAAIGTDLEKMKAAQANLTPERKQQVQDAVAAFGTQLQAVVRQAVADRSKDDAKAQAAPVAHGAELLSFEVIERRDAP